MKTIRKKKQWYFGLFMIVLICAAVFKFDAKTVSALTQNERAVAAYKNYLKSHEQNNYYAIVNAGENRKPVLIITGNYFEGRKITSAVHKPKGGYPIYLYVYSNGKVKKISGQIPQRISSGSWFLYNNKLCAFEARGGYTYLKISGESYQRVFVNRNIYKSPHIKQFSLKKNTYRLFKAPNLGSWKKTYDSAYSKPFQFDGVQYSIKWEQVRGATGYEVYFLSKDADDRTWFCQKSFTRRTSFSINFSHIDYDLKIKVRAYKIVDGKKAYGSWSNYKTKAVRF
ncbi:MAG: hypothetical protein MRZ74_03770 [Blautia sp.]|nr:hypothetical protein [Blautia sp.]MDY5030438.1 hypothetical protein [Blautia sp.]